MYEYLGHHSRDSFPSEFSTRVYPSPFACDISLPEPHYACDAFVACDICISGVLEAREALPELRARVDEPLPSIRPAGIGVARRGSVAVFWYKSE